jgi:hypothetical protein
MRRSTHGGVMKLPQMASAPAPAPKEEVAKPSNGTEVPQDAA